MVVIAVIPARGGSKGVKRKNVRPIGGVPLVARSIGAALAASRVDRVFVSTDDTEIAEVSRRWGGEVIDRPAEIAGDTASSEAALIHALDHLAAEGVVPERFVFLQCTSPFTTPEEIDACVAALDDPRYACALAAIPDHGFLWSVDADGMAHGINHDETRQRLRRQDSPPQYLETGSIYVARTEAFRAVGRRFCGPVALVPIDHPKVEIDNEADFALCDLMATNRARGDEPRFDGIRAVVMDFDGVHTDDLVTVDQDGREAVTCSRRDGMGLGALKTAGYALLILSKERNPVVTARGRKLGIEVLQAVDDKRTALAAWLGERGLDFGSTIFVGNDVNDLECMASAALAVAPSDAHPRALAAADLVLTLPGGRGALRELADLMLAGR